MSRALISLLCGMVFGVGLIIAQMTNPAKVIGFLDISGQWDPSLAVVMGAAVAVFSIAYRLALRRRVPIFEKRFLIPGESRVDKPLIIGSLIFGVGWGLVGFCPGPAIVSSGFGDPRVWAFVVAMLAGTLMSRTLRR